MLQNPFKGIRFCFFFILFSVRFCFLSHCLSSKDTEKEQVQCSLMIGWDTLGVEKPFRQDYISGIPYLRYLHDDS